MNQKEFFKFLTKHPNYTYLAENNFYLIYNFEQENRLFELHIPKSYKQPLGYVGIVNTAPWFVELFEKVKNILDDKNKLRKEIG